MTWWLLGAEVARAGGAVGAVVGPVAPLEEGGGVGMSYQGYLGDRLSVGPVHLQPEVTGRWNSAARAGAVSAGAAVSLSLGPVALGPYAHVGLGVGGGHGSVGDVGLLGEVTLLKPVIVGVRAGWQRDRVDQEAPSALVGYEPIPERWASVGLEVGLAF